MSDPCAIAILNVIQPDRFNIKNVWNCKCSGLMHQFTEALIEVKENHYFALVFGFMTSF
jgi:hypothetical protein